MTAVVIDNGCGVISAGFAGEDSPAAGFPAMVRVKKTFLGTMVLPPFPLPPLINIYYY